MYTEISNENGEQIISLIIKKLCLIARDEKCFEISRLDDDYEDFNDKLTLNREDFDELCEALTKMRMLMED